MSLLRLPHVGGVRLFSTARVQWSNNHLFNRGKSVLIDVNESAAGHAGQRLHDNNRQQMDPYRYVMTQLNRNNIQREFRAKQRFVPGNMRNRQKKDDQLFRAWNRFQNEKIKRLERMREWYTSSLS